MDLEAIKKINIGDQAYNQMKGQVIPGVQVPSEKMPSGDQLIEVFGVNRGTVCQTIQKLSAAELLETRRGKGSYMGQLGLANYFQSIVPAAFLNEDGLKEVFEFRMLSECGVTGMATENTTDTQIRKLEKNYKKMLQDLGNLEKCIEIDFKFHCPLRERIHSTLVCQMYKTIEDVLVTSTREGTEMIGFEHSRKGHGPILKVVQNHNSQAAREAIRHHITDHPVLALDVPAETKVNSLIKHI